MHFFLHPIVCFLGTVGFAALRESFSWGRAGAMVEVGYFKRNKFENERDRI